MYSSSLCFFTLLEIQILLPIILESPSVISSFPFLLLMIVLFGFPGGSVLNNLPAMQEMQETRVQSQGQNLPWRRKWQPTPVFLPGKSHGERSLAGYSPWGRKKVRQNLATTNSILSTYHDIFSHSLCSCSCQIQSLLISPSVCGMSFYSHDIVF